MIKKVVNKLNEEAYEALGEIKYESETEVKMTFWYTDELSTVKMELNYSDDEDYIVEVERDGSKYMTKGDVDFLRGVLESLAG